MNPLGEFSAFVARRVPLLQESRHVHRQGAAYLALPRAMAPKGLSPFGMSD